MTTSRSTITEYIVQWWGGGSDKWNHHDNVETVKQARKRRDFLQMKDPHIKFRAVKVVTTLL